MAATAEQKESVDDAIRCKSGFSDSFLLYLMNEVDKADNVKHYEHQYLQHNKVSVFLFVFFLSSLCIECRNYLRKYDRNLSSPSS